MPPSKLPDPGLEHTARQPAPDWLTALPIAHRGLHDATAGIAENSLAAATAAIDRGYAIELDLLASADGVPMVFHDNELDRLTNQTGPMAVHSAAQLSAIRHRAGETFIPTLAEFLAHVDGRVPLLIEIKRDAGAVGGFEAGVVDQLRGYRGEVAVMSFHPGRVAAIKRLARDIPRGLLSCRFEREYFRRTLSLPYRTYLRFLVPALWLRPQFVAYDVDHLPALATNMARAAGLALLAWTVKTPEQRARAHEHADQLIFEGITP